MTNEMKRLVDALERRRQIKLLAKSISIQLEEVSKLTEANKVSESIHALEMTLRDAKEVSKLILNEVA